jgi:hypothetical protein
MFKGPAWSEKVAKYSSSRGPLPYEKDIIYRNFAVVLLEYAWTKRGDVAASGTLRRDFRAAVPNVRPTPIHRFPKPQ